jgi:hypothetical protein
MVLNFGSRIDLHNDRKKLNSYSAMSRKPHKMNISKETLLLVPLVIKAKKFNL